MTGVRRRHVAPTAPAARQHGTWDLSPLEPKGGLRPEIESLLARCRRFAARYGGRLATTSAPALRTLLDELGEIQNRVSRLANYASMRADLKVGGEVERDLVAQVDAALAEAEDHLRFFEREWLDLPHAEATALAADPRLKAHRHFLLVMRQFKPHALSPPEERALACREASAADAWSALYDSVLAGVTVPLNSRAMTVEEALALLRDPDPKLRAQVYPAIARALEPSVDVLAHCYDSLVADRLAVDELRGFEHPRSARDLENELASATVDRLLDAIEAESAIARDWFLRKARRLGRRRLSLADLYAGEDLGPGGIDYLEAVPIVAEGLALIDPGLRGMAYAFEREGRIDAAPRAGKSRFSSCRAVSQDSRPYVQLQYGGTLADVLSLAHEIGHGIHFSLSAAAQTPLTSEPSLILGETAAMLAGLLVGEHLASAASGPDARVAITTARLDQIADTLFRQVALTRYESRAHAERGAGQTLTAARLTQYWLAAMEGFLGPGVEVTPEYGVGWALVPHFFHGRFYNYGYAIASLASLALFAAWQRDRAGFADRYLGFLTLGASAPPEDQLRGLAIDLTDPAFCQAALAQVRITMSAAVAASARVPT